MLIKLPDVPVIVTFTAAGAAEPLAVKVNVLVLAVALGLSDAVTPFGKPETDKFTLPLNPFCGATEMVLVPLVPGVRLKLLGEADSVKLADGLMVKATEVVFVKLPDVPVIVTLAVPATAALLAVNVNVLVLIVLLGLKDAVTPFGRPEADKLTVPLNPFCGVTEMVLVALAPCAMFRLVGAADIKKFGAALEEVSVTLSNVAVACAEAEPLLAAKPTYTLAAMGMIWLEPSCVHWMPSGEA